MGSSASRERQGVAANPVSASDCPVLNPQSPPDASATGAGSSNCPIPERYRTGPVYNVYSQRIDGALKSKRTLPLCCATPDTYCLLDAPGL